MTIELQTDFTNTTALRALIQEYMLTLPFAIDYQHPDKELNDLEAVYGAKGNGAMFVAREGDELAGCVALKPITHFQPQTGVRCCEMKRLYVRKKFRGQHLGKQLAGKIIQLARELGYHEMYLDTHREAQQQAIAMYRKMGFAECEDYHPNPGRLLCLRLDLRK